MQVELDKKFPLDAPSSRIWDFLQEIEKVVECLPGAEITERTDDSHYKGQIKLKVGPASSTFKGDLEVLGMDEAQRELHIQGKGKDTKGSSNASMDLRATVHEDSNGKSELAGVAEVTVTGKMANFGGRMIEQVSDQILQQFADNLNDRLVADSGSGEEAQEAAKRVEQQPKSFNVLQFAWQMVMRLFGQMFGSKK